MNKNTGIIILGIILVLLLSFNIGYFLGKNSDWTKKAIERLDEAPGNRITIISSSNGNHYTFMEVDKSCVDKDFKYSCYTGFTHEEAQK